MSARQLRLIGAAAMLDAIREARVHFFAAEMEVGLAGVAHRPAADAIVEIKQAGLAGHFWAGLGWHEAARRGRRDRCLLIAGALTQKAAGADRDNPLLRPGGRRSGHGTCCRCRRRYGAWRGHGSRRGAGRGRLGRSRCFG